MNNGRTKKTIDEMNIIDDTFFHKMAEDIGFCEEMLSVILQQKVMVTKVVPQGSYKNLQGRSVVVDCSCILEDGTSCDVEVQKANDDDHIRRVRYKASCITANITSPGTDFREVPNVIMIFISKFDIFKGKKTIYHIDRTIRETGNISENGLQEIYVNTKIDDGSTIADLMKLFKEESLYDFEKFPRTSARKYHFKKNEGGRAEMCEVVERYAREYAKECIEEEARKAVRKLFENGATVELVKKVYDIAEDVLKEIYEDVQRAKE